MQFKHKDILLSEALPKREGMMDRFKNNPKMAQGLRNYIWEWYADDYYPPAFHQKYRRHGQFNGKKSRKRERIRKSRLFRRKYKNALLVRYDEEV